MKFWVGVTDKDWFEFLASRAPDEVNFWQPSAAAMPRFLEPGIPFARSGPWRTRFRTDGGQRSGVMADSIAI
jgi:hypothetical protein